MGLGHEIWMVCVIDDGRMMVRYAWIWRAMHVLWRYCGRNIDAVYGMEIDG